MVGKLWVDSCARTGILPSMSGNKGLKPGDRVRIKSSAPRHGGKIGYVDTVGEGPSAGTVILCTKNREEIPTQKENTFCLLGAILFAAYVDDVEPYNPEIR